MKKRIILLISLLLMTGCTCEYNLHINNNNKYSEEIIITTENSSEANDLKNDWQIPTEVDEFNLGRDSDKDYTGEIYDYQVDDKKLNLKKEYTFSKFQISTAPNACFSSFNISKYEGNIIISSSDEFLCFEKYQDLTNIKINITIDNKVISNNADSVKDNTYTWNISKNESKSINIIIDNSNNDNIDYPNEISKEETKNNKKSLLERLESSNYLIAIFILIIIIIVIIGYLIFNKLKDRNNKLDD